MEENEIKVNKKTLYIVGVLIVVGVIAIFVFGGGKATGNIVSGSDGLSGNLVDMDPNRAMAGAPCHAMGDQIMGDCATREVNLEAWLYDWSEPTITVKSGEFVKIYATSKDVSHGFSIPQINFNMVIEPGRTTLGEFIAPSPGVYEYGCSVMCGPGHHNMKGKLVVI